MGPYAKWEQRCNSCAWGVALAMVLIAGRCWGDSVEPLLPESAQIFGWGRQAPAVRLEARAVHSQPVKRVFVSAIILDAQGKTIDRVPLYDDGTHGDKQAGDLVFTEVYTPRFAGVFQVRFKAEWERDGERFTRFSEVRPFEVVYAPYARFVNKHEAERPSVGSAVNAEVVLLFGDEKRYSGSLENISIQASCTPSGNAELPENLTPQTTVRYLFVKPGEHQLRVQALMTYKGQPIATEPDTLTVVYNHAPAWLFWLGVLAVVIAGVLRSKRVLIYEHQFQVVNPTYGTQTSLTLTANEPSLEIPGVAVTLDYVKGSEQVKLASGVLTLDSGERLEAGALLNAGEQYRTDSGQILQFCESMLKGEESVAPRFVPNTLPKVVSLLVGVGVIIWYFVLQHQLGQLANL